MVNHIHYINQKKVAQLPCPPALCLWLQPQCQENSDSEAEGEETELSFMP